MPPGPPLLWAGLWAGRGLPCCRRQGSLAHAHLRDAAQIEGGDQGPLFDYVSCVHASFDRAAFEGDMYTNAPIFFRSADCEGASFYFSTIIGADFSGSNFKQATLPSP